MKETFSLLRLGRAFLQLSLTYAILLNVTPLFAQHGGGRPPSPPPQAPTAPQSATDLDQNRLFLDSSSKGAHREPSKGVNCLLPPLSGVVSPTVGVGDLHIPAKAKKAYENGCAALAAQKTAEADNQLRKAVKEWPKYSFAWITLGQVLEAEQKTAEAQDACFQPLAADPRDLLAYLCLADISARSQNWNRVIELSTRALEIDPTGDAVAYDYYAAANFNLHHLKEAEKSALRAVEIDKNNADPRVHFLLAQIYEAEGDRSQEAAQLREYLKYARDPTEVIMVRSYLAALDRQSK